MLYELRIYEAVPGKLPAVQARFRDHTNDLFARHGFEVVGYWTNEIGPSNQQLIYILAWRDLTHRQEAWANFVGDPDWQSAKAASEKDGPLVANILSSILKPTDFSPMQ